MSLIESFNNFCNPRLKQITLLNYDKLIKNLYSDSIKIKIKNYIEKFYLDESVSSIIDKINNDKLFAMFFIKDPKKQNFYECMQIEYIKNILGCYDVKKLTNILYFDYDSITNFKTNTSTKSIDFISNRYELLFTAKHIQENGGAQDNQFRDLIIFINTYSNIKNWLNYKNYKLIIVISGNYFNTKIVSNILENINNSNILILNLNDINSINDFIILLKNQHNMNKKEFGQFYTTNYELILKNLNINPPTCKNIIEPFIGKGDLLPICKKYSELYNVPILTYDIDPHIESGVITMDTLKNPPDYENSIVITNPPYLARNKTKSKEIFDIYGENDLYKCFLRSIIKGNVIAGIVIIPLNFWCGVRINDVKLRDAFLQKYKINQLNIFTNGVFDDTNYTVCSFSFERLENIISNQLLNVCIDDFHTTFSISKKENWLIGYDVHNTQQNPNIKIIRLVENIKIPENFNKANFKIYCLDSSSNISNIRIEIVEDNDLYIGKITSRTEASIAWNLNLSIDDQRMIAKLFNNFLNKKRKIYNSLFLSNYRENNRKRIGFDLAFRLLNTATLIYCKMKLINIPKI